MVNEDRCLHIKVGWWLWQGGGAICGGQHNKNCLGKEERKLPAFTTHRK